MLNAFPKRRKPVWAMVALILLLFAVIIAVDVIYLVKLVNGVTTDQDAIKITMKNYFIVEAQYALIAHIVMIALTTLTVIFEPVIAKLLRRINTSIDVDDNGMIDAIDISEEG
jgi:hypothetical protein